MLKINDTEVQICTKRALNLSEAACFTSEPGGRSQAEGFP